MNAKVMPASVKIRRWFVAAVAAIMAIAWTVSSLVTPGTAYNGGSEDIAYTAVKDWNLNHKGGGYSLQTRDHNDVPTSNGLGWVSARVEGNTTGKLYPAICIDPAGGSPASGTKSYTKSSFQAMNNFSARSIGRGDAVANQELARKFAMRWGDQLAAEQYKDIWTTLKADYKDQTRLDRSYPSRHPLQAAGFTHKLILDSQQDSAEVLGAALAGWSLNGRVSIENSQALWRGKPAPNVTNAARAMADAMIMEARNYTPPSTPAGQGASIGPKNIHIDSNLKKVGDKYEVIYNVTSKNPAMDKGTLSLSGVPGDAVAYDQDGNVVTDGSKIKIPNRIKLLIPVGSGNMKNIRVGVKTDPVTVNTNTGGSQGGTTGNIKPNPDADDKPFIVKRRIEGPVGTDGKQAQLTITGAPADAKFYNDETGATIESGSVVKLPLTIRIEMPAKSAYLYPKIKIQAKILDYSAGKPFIYSAAGAGKGSTVDSAQWVGDNYVVKYTLDGGSQAFGKKATLTVTGLPKGGKLVDDSTGASLSTGSKVTMPAHITLTLPKSSARYFPYVRIKAFIPGTEVGNSTYDIPINIGKTVSEEAYTVTITGLPDGTVIKGFPDGITRTVKGDHQKVEVANQKLPLRLVATVPGNKQAFVNVSLRSEAPDADAQVSVTQHSYDDLGNGTKQFYAKVTGKSDSGNATVTLTLPPGVTAEYFHDQFQRGKPLSSGDNTVPLGGMVRITVPAGTPAGKAVIAAKTTDTKGGMPGQILKPGDDSRQWLLVIDSTPGSTAEANASIDFTWQDNEGPVNHFKLMKKVVGPVAIQAKDKEYEFNISCNTGTRIVNETATVKPDEVWQSADYPIGTQCTVREDPASAEDEQYPLESIDQSQETITIQQGDPVTFTVTNKYKLPEKKYGRLVIKKVVSGVEDQDLDKANSVPFSFKVTCKDEHNNPVYTNNDVTVYGNNSAVIGVSDDDSKKLPAGSTCRVEENKPTPKVDGYNHVSTTLAGSENVDVDQEDGVAVATIQPGTQSAVTVTATNVYEREKPREGYFTIKKAFASDSSYQGTDGHTFSFRYKCGTDHWKTVQVGDNKAKKIGPFIEGTPCTVAEDTSTSAVSVPGHTYLSTTLKGSDGVDVGYGGASFTIKDDSTAPAELIVTAVNKYSKPAVHTNASAKNEYNKLVKNEPVQLVDKVTVQNINCSSYYTLKGWFVKKGSGERTSPITQTFYADDPELASNISISRNSADGTCNAVVTMTDPKWTVQATSSDEAWVGFESLYDGGFASGTEIAVHHKINDPAQTVTTKKVGTFQVTKKLNVDGEEVNSQPVGVAGWNFQYRCADDAASLGTWKNLQGTATVNRTATPGTNVEFPIGSVCQVRELPNATTGTYKHVPPVVWENATTVNAVVNGQSEKVAQFTITQPDTTLKVVAHNKLEKKKGKLKIVKTVVDEQGSVISDLADHKFKFNLDCGGEVKTVEASVNTPYVSDFYPIGTDCTVTEQTNSAKNIKGYSFKKATVANPTVTIEEGQEPVVQVKAKNVYTKPTLGTTAGINGQEGKTLTNNGKPVQLKDTIHFTNLEKGKTYTVGGYFVDKANQEAVTEFYSKTFTTDDLINSSGTKLVNGDLVLTSDKWTVTPVNGQELVAFEYLWEGTIPGGTDPRDPDDPNKPVEKHEDPKDPAQKVSTEETGKFKVTKVVKGTAAGKIPTDPQFDIVVTCDGADSVAKFKKGETREFGPMAVGTKCTVKEVNAPKHFKDATLKSITYKVDGQPTNSLTVKKGNKANITVEVINEYDTPKVTTDADTPAGPAAADPQGFVKVTDQVTYTNVIAGEQYTVQGHLVYQSGSKKGQIVKGVKAGQDAEQVNDTTISRTFNAPGEPGELVSGTIPLNFLVPASALREAPLVVFEDLKYGDLTVATHHDITDEKQTTGDVRFKITKIVDTAALAGDTELKDGTYNFRATCGDAAPQNISVKVTDGRGTSKDVVVANVGDTCTVTETTDVNGDAVSNTVTFADPGIDGVTANGNKLVVKITKANKDDLNNIAFEVTNKLEDKLGQFKATKVAVNTEDVDSDLPIPTKFEFEYSCDKGATWTSMGKVAEGESTATVSKPVGTQCMIRENVERAQVEGADLATTYSLNNVPASPDAANKAISFTVGNEGTVMTVGANNKYAEKKGSFELQKKAAESANSKGMKDVNYTLKYTCTKGSTYSKSAEVVVKGNGNPVPVTGIPLGSQCTVEEINLDHIPGTFHQLTWTRDGLKMVADSNNKVTFQLNDADSVATITAHNVFTDNKAGFTLTKFVDGTAFNKPAADKKYQFMYSCKDKVTGSTIADSFSLKQGQTFQSGNVDKLKDLSEGSRCSITEIPPTDIDPDSQWDGVSFSTDATSGYSASAAEHKVEFTIPSGNKAINFTATNVFNQKLGKLKVVKQLKADGVDGVPTGYQFTVSCVDPTGRPVDIAKPTHVVSAGESITWNGLPVGATCTVTEKHVTPPGHATHVKTWKVNDGATFGGDTAQVKVTQGTTATVTAINEFTNKEGKFTVEKRSAKVTGTAAEGKQLAKAPTTFNFEYRCGDDTDWTAMAPVTVAGVPAASESLPAKSVCQVREKLDGSSSRIVSWEVDGVVQPQGDTTSVTVKPNATVRVVVDNVYPTEPQIGTTLTDLANNKNITIDGDKVILKDVVKYYNLDTSKTYKASGELMVPNKDKTSATPTGITAESEEFKPETANGSITVNFTLTREQFLNNPELVAYEQLTVNGKVVAKHEDPKDPNQTVKANPEIGTTLTGEDGTTKTFDRPVDPDDTLTLVDTVAYTNLEVGKYYRVSGELIGDKGATGVKAVQSEPFLVTAPEGKPDAKFASGTTQLKFVVPGSVLQNNSKLVAFERLWDESKIVPPVPGAEEPTPKVPGDEPTAKHEDPKDPDQTVRANPSAATFAAFVDVDGKQTTIKEYKNTGKENQTIKVVDKLNWYNFAEGDYVAFASLHDAATGNSYGTAKGTKQFTVAANEQKGVVEVPITLPIDSKQEGELDLVVFEKIYKASDVVNGDIRDGAKPVASHEDKADPNQKLNLVVYPPKAPEGSVVVRKVATTFTGSKHTIPADTKFGFEFYCDKFENFDNPPVFRFTVVNGQSQTIKSGYYVGQQCYVKEIGPVAADYNDQDGWQPVEIDGLDWKALSWTENGDQAVVESQAPGATVTDAQKVRKVKITEEEQQLTLTANNFYQDEPEPTLKTNAKDQADGDQTVMAETDAVIADIVDYTNLKPETEYTIKGELHKKVGGQDAGVITTATAAKGCLVDNKNVAGVDCKDEGNGVVSLTFTTPKAEKGQKRVSGNVELHFNVPGNELKADQPVVAFEGLHKGDVEIAKHHNINDPKQTVNVTPKPKKPVIQTKAANVAEGGVANEVTPIGDVNIVDTVSYTNLKPNTTYTMKGDMRIKDGTKDGKVITSAKAGTACTADEAPVECKDEGKGVVSVTFTTPAAENPKVRNQVDGKVQVAFVIPGKVLVGEPAMVAFETAYEGGKEVASHHEINDVNQTVKITPPPEPKIETTAKDAEDNDKEVEEAKEAVISDRVDYVNLHPNTKYTIKGALHKKVNGKDGGVITTATAGTQCQVGDRVVEGIDCKDEGQGYVSLTFTTPDATTANTPVSGYVVLKFKVPAKELQAYKHVVAFETAYDENGEVAKHHDIDDDSQTVKVTPKPTLKTSAEDAARDGKGEYDRTVEAGKDATIIDTVTYTGLRNDTEYTIYGELHMKVKDQDQGVVTEAKAGTQCAADGVGVECKTVEGKPGVVAITFQPKGAGEDGYANGTVQLAYVVPADALHENSEMVVFERAATTGKNPEIVVKHEDINDEDQTVNVVPKPPKSPKTPEPGVKTNATVDGKKDIEKANVDRVVTDLVTLSQLQPNKEYTVKGQLHDQDTGEPLTEGVTAGDNCKFGADDATCKDEGNGVVSITFTTPKQNAMVTVGDTDDPTATRQVGVFNGTLTMNFKVAGEQLTNGRSMVVFEDAYDGQKKVAVHNNLKDKAQTVSVKEPTPPKTPGTPPSTPPNTPPSTPGVPMLLAKTGSTAFTLIVLGMMGLMVGGLLIWASPARRRVAESDE